MSLYCVQLTKILTFEGHIFNQELAFHFFQVPFPVYFALKTINISNECLVVQNINVHTFIPILGRTTGIKDGSLDSNKYLNLGAMKKKIKSLLPTGYSTGLVMMTCNLYF